MTLNQEFPNPCFGKSGQRVFDYEARRVYVICSSCGAEMPASHGADNVGYLPLHNKETS